MHADPVVMATLGGVRDWASTEEYLEANIDHWENHGFGLYTLRQQDGAAFVGRAGLRRIELEGSEEVEVAYALRSETWGHGLAVAVTLKLVRVATEVGLCDELVAFTLTTNRRSWRVMEKAGFVFDREIDHAGSAHVLYRRHLPGTFRGVTATTS